MNDITGGSFVCNVQNDELEKNCITCVVDEDHIDYPGKSVTPTAEILAP